MSDMTNDMFALLFRNHMAELHQTTTKVLEEMNLTTLVLSSGAPFTYFFDDQEAPFKSNAHFSRWCPIEGPHHVLVISPGEKALLVRFAPEDYWYEPSELGDPFWLSEFDLVEAETLDDVWKAVGSIRNGAYIGNEPLLAKQAGIIENPKDLIDRLDWGRAYKTDYELECLKQANELAATGHRAAYSVFESGGSEFDIHCAFVHELGVVEEDLPYPTIIALDEKASFLHYHKKRKVRDGQVLLIDAGAERFGYASDITRTLVSLGCDTRFVALQKQMNILQQDICELVKPGVTFGELHENAHFLLAVLLKENELLKVEPEEAINQGLTRAFFPHGLGHHLGLQVHDVGGQLADSVGTLARPPVRHPYLRNTRTIEARHVFTVEPGLYFIKMLLRPFRDNALRNCFNWSLIDELTPLGGIRIEDDLVVTEDGHKNLTRCYLPD